MRGMHTQQIRKIISSKFSKVAICENLVLYKSHSHTDGLGMKLRVICFTFHGQLLGIQDFLRGFLTGMLLIVLLFADSVPEEDTQVPLFTSCMYRTTNQYGH